jgi:hypothetical protein
MARAIARAIALGVTCLALVVAGSACSRSHDWQVGGLYSVSGGDGQFGVVKVLARDEGVVSVRIYSDQFADRPASASSASLSLGRVDDSKPGIGHMPIDEREFARWFPVFIAQEAVGEDELEGYRYWKESGGGAFSGEALQEMGEQK